MTTMTEKVAAQYVHSLGQSKPSDLEWRTLVVSLGRVPTAEEQAEFTVAWEEQHRAWLALRAAQGLDPS